MGVPEAGSVWAQMGGGHCAAEVCPSWSWLSHPGSEVPAQDAAMTLCTFTQPCAWRTEFTFRRLIEPACADCPPCRWAPYSSLGVASTVMDASCRPRPQRQIMSDMARCSTFWPASGRYPSDVLRASSWTIRVGAFVLLGIYIFRGDHLPPGKHSVVLAAYIVAGVMMALWESLRWRRSKDATSNALENYSLLALAGVVTASGAAAPIQHAGPLAALGVVATLDAGTDASLTAGWSIFAAGVLAIEIGALFVGAGIVVVLGYPLLLLLGLLGGHNRRAYRVKAEQSALMLDQLTQLRAEQRRVAVLDERTRIAREIHDVLAHSLGSLGIQIQVARAVLEDHQDTDRAIKALVIAQGIATEGLVETRRAVHALRSDILPLPEELARTGLDHERRHGTAVNMTTKGIPRTLRTEISLALLRIARESLTNAAKHAPGQPVSLRLEYSNGEVILEVSNPLNEVAPATSFATVNGGYGLIGMKERLLLLGGSLATGVTDNHWVVTARIAE